MRFLRMLVVVLVVGMLCVTSKGQAEELFSCDDLIEFANALDEIAGYLEQIDTIVEGDEVDVALGEVVDGLEAIVQVEQDRNLRRGTRELAAAWDNMDRGRLMNALDANIDALDMIVRRDCR